jgi:hypothetical protein
LDFLLCHSHKNRRRLNKSRSPPRPPNPALLKTVEKFDKKMKESSTFLANKFHYGNSHRNISTIMQPYKPAAFDHVASALAFIAINPQVVNIQKRSFLAFK